MVEKNNETIFQTKDGRLLRKGDLCHFSGISGTDKSWSVCAWGKEESEDACSSPTFQSTDLWILLSVQGSFGHENIIILHPNLGKITVPFDANRIVLVCPAKPNKQSEQIS